MPRSPVAEDFRHQLELATDRVAFARTLKDPGTGEPIVPSEWQHDLLRSTSPRILLNCSRQSGKSTTSATIALHRALFYPGSLILCLAPALRQSQELFRKILDFYRQQGRPIPALEENKTSLELENGSRIVTLPGKEGTIRGFSGVTLLLMDEAAQVPDGLYYAVRPMLSKSAGSLMLLSTPYGKRGVFYEEWTNGIGWERYEAKATDLPADWFKPSTEAYLAEERASLPPYVFRQEYLCSFEETDDQVFTTDVIDRAVSPTVPTLFGAA